MVPTDAECSDMEAVSEANPLSTITPESLAADFDSATLDLGDWKRLRCNRATRAAVTAISDREWDEAEVEAEIPAGEHVDVGLDVGWKWDTTAFVPLWKGPEYRLMGPASIIVPPRD